VQPGKLLPIESQIAFLTERLDRSISLFHQGELAECPWWGEGIDVPPQFHLEQFRPAEFLQ
jgi:hypothetical protein